MILWVDESRNLAEEIHGMLTEFDIFKDGIA